MRFSLRRILILFGTVIFVAHISTLLVCGPRPAGPIWSNILQFLLGALAATSASIGGFEEDSFSKRLRCLTAVGLWIWTAGQFLLTLSDYFLHRELHSDHLLFFWPFTLLLAAALDPGSDRDNLDGTLFLDVVQILIIAFVLDLFLFGPTLGAPLARLNLDALRWKARLIRDLVILGAIVLRGRLSNTTHTRQIYWRIAIILGSYTIADGLYLYGQLAWHFTAGQLWDVLWSIPRLLTLLVMMTWPSSPADGEHESCSRLCKRYLLLHTLPVVVPLVVLGIAGAIARYSFPLMMFMVVASMACAAIRLLITQNNELLATRNLQSMNEELANWKNRYDEALIASGRVVYDWNMDVGAIDYGSSFQQNFGLSTEEIGIHHDAWVERIHPEDRRKYVDAVARAVTNADRLNCEYRVMLAAPEYKVVNDTGQLVTDAGAGHRHLTGILSDITSQRKLEQQLFKAQRMESIGTLSGGIAHDFNNLITVIQGFCEMAQNRISDAQASEDLKEVQGAATRAATLTRQLLAFSRRQVLQPQFVQINQVVADLHKMLRRLIGEDIEFLTRLSQNVGTIYVDPMQLEQVIMNLVVNARDAMPRGGRLIIETANVHFDEELSRAHFGASPGAYVSLRVTDSGEGMSQEVQAHIFEPFFTTKPLGQGTGLGLATVYGIVKQSDGYITCSSEPGNGSTFKLYFPRALGVDAASKRPAAIRAAEARGSHTILLAEDDHHVRRFTEKILQEFGYKVLSATGPAMAQRLAREFAAPIDLLITDMVMPECSGQELAACVRALHPDMRVLFISGYSDSARHGAISAADGFLPKPFSGQSLGIKLRELLAQ